MLCFISFGLPRVISYQLFALDAAVWSPLFNSPGGSLASEREVLRLGYLLCQPLPPRRLSAPRRRFSCLFLTESAPSRVQLLLLAILPNSIFISPKSVAVATYGAQYEL